MPAAAPAPAPSHAPRPAAMYTLFHCMFPHVIYHPGVREFNFSRLQWKPCSSRAASAAQAGRQPHPTPQRRPCRRASPGVGAAGRAQPSVGCCDCRRHRGSEQQAAGCLSLLRVMCGAARAACGCLGLPNGLCGFAPSFLHRCASPLSAQQPAQQPCTATHSGASPAAHRPRPRRPGQPCPVHAAW